MRRHNVVDDATWSDARARPTLPPNAPSRAEPSGGHCRNLLRRARCHSSGRRRSCSAASGGGGGSARRLIECARPYKKWSALWARAFTSGGAGSAKAPPVRERAPNEEQPPPNNTHTKCHLFDTSSRAPPYLWAALAVAPRLRPLASRRVARVAQHNQQLRLRQTVTQSLRSCRCAPLTAAAAQLL